MQVHEAQNLQKGLGNNCCNHSIVEKEYYLGAATGDYVCKQCGKSGWGSDWNTKNVQTEVEASLE